MLGQCKWLKLSSVKSDLFIQPALLFLRGLVKYALQRENVQLTAIKDKNPK